MSCHHRLGRQLNPRPTAMVLQDMLSSSLRALFLVCRLPITRNGWLGSPRAQTRWRVSKTRAPCIDPVQHGRHPRQPTMHRLTSSCMSGMSSGATHPAAARIRFAATGTRTAVLALRHEISRFIKGQTVKQSCEDRTVYAQVVCRVVKPSVVIGLCLQ